MPSSPVTTVTITHEDRASTLPLPLPPPNGATHGTLPTIPNRETREIRELEPPGNNKSNNRWNLRLSEGSKQILKLLKKNLYLTYDEQIQLLGRLVLHHELLNQTSALELEINVRQLRRFSPSREQAKGQEPLRLQPPAPLNALLGEINHRLELLEGQLVHLAKAIDAKSELELLRLELEPEPENL